MLIFGVFAVRLNIDQTRITEVLWQEIGTNSIDYNPTVAGLPQVNEVLATGNKVFLILQNELGIWNTTTAEFKQVSYQDAEIGIYNIEFELENLPSF